MGIEVIVIIGFILAAIIVGAIKVVAGEDGSGLPYALGGVKIPIGNVVLEGIGLSALVRMIANLILPDDPDKN